MGKHRVVIIGSGFAGLFAAKALTNEDVAITLIDRTSHHLFQPLLYQVATGILSPGQIAPSTREILHKQKNVRVLLGLVEDIDPKNKQVIWRNHTNRYSTDYDSLIVATGAGQSYFGNDQFARFAPGMKSIDDALELRARIFGAFERAELEEDSKAQQRLLTFVVVGAGATGVEMAGQIRELASRTLKGEFRNVNPEDARVILVDGASTPLPAFGEKLGGRTRHELEKLGVEVRMNQLVTDLDADSVTLQDKDKNIEVIPCVCKVWAAGVQGSALGKKLAAATGVELDRAGRVKVDEHLQIPGYRDIFVVGDLVAREGVPGVAQGAIQSGRYVARVISARLAGREVSPFEYWDKGSMATIAKFSAVASIGKFKFHGFPAWLAWCFLHLLYIAGFKARVGTLLHWLISFLSNARSARTTTNQQLVGRLALERFGTGASGKLLRGENLHLDEDTDTVK